MAADVIIRIKAEDLASGDIKDFRQELAKIKKELEEIARSNPFGSGGGGGAGKPSKPSAPPSKPFVPPVEETRSFAEALKSVQGVVGAIGLGIVAREMADLATFSLTAADNLNAVHAGLTVVYGSAELASERFEDLNELAKFPGLDPEPLARFDAIFKNLGNTATENDTIFLGAAKAITTFGGNVSAVNSTLLQLSQAFSKNKVDAQDIKSIIEQTGGSFITVAEDVLGFKGGIDGLSDAFDASGKTLQEFLLPVFDEMGKRFEGAPVTSYTNRVDNLGVAFKNLSAEMGNRLMPTISEYLGILTELIEKETEVWKQSREVGEAIKATATEQEQSVIQTRLLQKEYLLLSSRLQDQKEKYEQYLKAGLIPTSASAQQLQRNIEGLESAVSKKSDELDKAKTALIDVSGDIKTLDTSMKGAVNSTDNMGTALGNP